MRKLLKAVLIALILMILLIVVNNIKSIVWQSDRAINIELQQADSLMFIKPDSSLYILNSIKQNYYNLDAEGRAFYALLFTQAQMRNYIKQKDDSLINVAIDYYTTSNDSIRKAWTYFYASAVNNELGEKAKALSFIQKADRTAKGSGDNKLICYIYYLWGRLLQHEKPYSEGINKLIESEKYARILNDTSLIVSRIMDRGWSYMFVGDFDLAEDTFNEAISIAEKSDLKGELSSLYFKLSNALYEKGVFSESLKNINKSIEYIKYRSDSLKLFDLKGAIFIQLNQLDSARYYIKRGKEDGTLYNNAAYQESMASLEAKGGNYQKAYEYKTAYANYLDSIREYEENTSVMALQRRYDYAQVKAEKDRLEIEKKEKDIFLLICLVALIIFVFAAYIIIVTIKKRADRNIKIKDEMLDRSIKQLQSKSNELMVSKKIHKDAEESLLDNLMNKQEELSKVKSREQDFVNYIFNISEVIQKIESLKEMNEKKRRSMALSVEEFKGLIEAIDLCYDNFTVRLKAEFPNLTSDDIYMCCMLKMKISTHDIAVLLNISEETLRKRKYRLKSEKFNLPQDRESLDSFLDDY